MVDLELACVFVAAGLEILVVVLYGIDEPLLEASLARRAGHLLDELLVEVEGDHRSISDVELLPRICLFCW